MLEPFVGRPHRQGRVSRVFVFGCRMATGSDGSAGMGIDGGEIVGEEVSSLVMESDRTLNQWWRFPAAIVVAFIAASVTGFLFVLMLGVFHVTSESAGIWARVLPFVMTMAVGFNGVFTGARILRHEDRIIGAMILLVLGLGFETV